LDAALSQAPSSEKSSAQVPKKTEGILLMKTAHDSSSLKAFLGVAAPSWVQRRIRVRPNTTILAFYKKEEDGKPTSDLPDGVVKTQKLGSIDLVMADTVSTLSADAAQEGMPEESKLKSPHAFIIKMRPKSQNQSTSQGALGIDYISSADSEADQQDWVQSLQAVKNTY